MINISYHFLRFDLYVGHGVGLYMPLSSAIPGKKPAFLGKNCDTLFTGREPLILIKAPIPPFTVRLPTVPKTQSHGENTNREFAAFLNRRYPHPRYPDYCFPAG